MDIWDIKVEGPNTGELAKMVQTGQKVKVTRMATITYTLDISDFLDESDDTVITVEDLIEGETDVMAIWDIESNYDDADIVEDRVISVELV
jgi:hypothetical protein